jgi:hypothetical protein
VPAGQPSTSATCSTLRSAQKTQHHHRPGPGCKNGQRIAHHHSRLWRQSLGRAVGKPAGEKLTGVLEAPVGQVGVDEGAVGVGVHGVLPPDFAPGHKHLRQRRLRKVLCEYASRRTGGTPCAAAAGTRPPRTRRTPPLMSPDQRPSTAAHPQLSCWRPRGQHDRTWNRCARWRIRLHPAPSKISRIPPASALA